MKGIGHFLTGVAVASCFPEAMHATLNDNSMIMLMGGAFGLLPDTMDFRIGRYLWKQDHTLTPDLNALNAKIVAELVAGAIDESDEKQEMVRVKLHTLKVSANYHRTYSIRIDADRKVVHAEIGPLKTMGQIMGGGGHLPESLPTGVSHGPLTYEAPFKANFVNPYHAGTTVGIFSGPDFAFVPDKDQVRMDFIPWHRTWAHSPFVGVICGLLGWLLYSLAGYMETGAASSFYSPLSLTAFGIGLLAFWGHIFVDQFGVLGSVLLWPFSDKRSSGFKWTHAASVLGNITLNYVCIAIVMWNLIVFTDEAGVIMPWAAGMEGGYGNIGYYLVSLLNFAVYYLAVPIAALHVGARLYRRFIPAITYPKPTYAAEESSEESREAEDEGLDGPGELGTI